jgi:predicted transcriptional regulator
MEQKITNIETRLNGAEKDILDIKSDIKDLDRRQSVSEAKQNETSSDIKELSKEVKEVNTMLKAHIQSQEITNSYLKELIIEIRNSRDEDRNDINQIKLQLVKENKDQDIAREKDKNMLLIKVFGVIGFLITSGLAIWAIIEK